VQTYEELAEIHETGNDGAYIRKRHNLKDAYQNEKYVKIKKDETIINLLHGPASQIIGEKKKCIELDKHYDSDCNDAHSCTANSPAAYDICPISCDTTDTCAYDSTASTDTTAITSNDNHGNNADKNSAPSAQELCTGKKERGTNKRGVKLKRTKLYKSVNMKPTTYV
jgi:hypothetical protein